MADRPILFSGPMVRALLAGRKTQTRRVLKPQPPAWANFCEQPSMFNYLHQWVPSGLWRWAELDDARHRAMRQWPLDEEGQHYWLRLPFGTSDRLWVRESWCTLQKWDGLAPRHLPDDPSKVTFEADPEHRNPFWAFGKLRPGMFMPRWASRLTLAVTDVRVERIQDISEADARAEGIVDGGCLVCGQHEPCGCADPTPDARDSFVHLWDGLNAKRGFGWAANPWVVVLTFTVHHQNIDALGAKETT